MIANVTQESGPVVLTPTRPVSETLSEVSNMTTVPAIISVAPHRLGGLAVIARFACGHEQLNVFPHAPRRSSRQQIKGWLFGSRPQEETCSRCRREAAEARS